MNIFYDGETSISLCDNDLHVSEYNYEGIHTPRADLQVAANHRHERGE